MFKKTFIIICTFFIMTFGVGSFTLSQGQQPPVSQWSTSGDIIADCGIQKLNPQGDQAKFAAQKRNFYAGCIQGIIRFIVVLSATFAIIRIAIVGLGELNPLGGGNPQIKATIQNLVIGLALLTMGWYIIPIFNGTFSKVNFLEPPSVRQIELDRLKVIDPLVKKVLDDPDPELAEISDAYVRMGCGNGVGIAEVDINSLTGVCKTLKEKYNDKLAKELAEAQQAQKIRDQEAQFAKEEADRLAAIEYEKARKAAEAAQRLEEFNKQPATNIPPIYIRSPQEDARCRATDVGGFSYDASCAEFFQGLR
jgi:hypothetical protein